MRLPRIDVHKGVEVIPPPRMSRLYWRRVLPSWMGMAVALLPGLPFWLGLVLGPLVLAWSTLAFVRTHNEAIIECDEAWQAAIARFRTEHAADLAQVPDLWPGAKWN